METTLKENAHVVVSKEMLHPIFAVDIKGWKGTITNIIPKSGKAVVKWDEATLNNVPEEIKQMAPEDFGRNFTQLPLDSLKLISTAEVLDQFKPPANVEAKTNTRNKENYAQLSISQSFLTLIIWFVPFCVVSFYIYINRTPISSIISGAKTPAASTGNFTMGMVIFLGILELIILIMTVTYFIGLLKAIKLTFTGVKCDVEICDLWAKRKGRGRRSRHYVSFRIEGILIVQIIS
ncbi:MAG: hypothetical protein ABSG15_06620, partial [FCB group bacterium]